METKMIKKWIISLNRPYTEELDYNRDENDIILLTEEQDLEIENELKKGGKFLTCESGILVLKNTPKYNDNYYYQQEIDANALIELAQTDWKIIRELERMFLSDTDLHKQREDIRKKVLRLTPTIEE